MPLYRVLAGSHTEGGRIWRRGEIVETNSDLLKMNSPGSTKFEKLEGDVRATRGTSIRPELNAPQESKTPSGAVTSGFQGGPPPAERKKMEAQQQQAQATQTKDKGKQAQQPTNDREYHAALDKMTDAELQQHAREENVDLRGATKRQDVLAILKNPK